MIRRGLVNNAVVVFAGTLVILGVVGWMLMRMDQQSAATGNLIVYCAAGTRPGVEKVVEQYEKDYGVSIQIQYQGSNTLLSQIETSRLGDVYIAADDTYIEMGQERGLIKEAIPLARQRPVIAVAAGNPKNIKSVRDLLRKDVTTSMGSPDQAAVGRVTRRLLQAEGLWGDLEKHVTEYGTFKPTVPAVANDVKLGSVDAGIVWDSTLTNYPDLEAIRTPELDQGTANITVGVLTSARAPAKALHFARYLGAPEKGLAKLDAHGFEVVDGDAWAEVPELTFFCGAVNQRAVTPIIEAFKKRENVRVNAVFNGCGMLTGQMRTIRQQKTGTGFPDTYMACDVYYLKEVEEWFQEAVNVSDTRIVIAVAKGNPKDIHSLQDLTRTGIRVAVGQPKQCTIGVLTNKLLEAEGLLDQIEPNILVQVTSSANLVPQIVTQGVDAALVYATDTLAEADKVDAIEIESNAATAIQPFSIARSSPHKHLARRLFAAVAASPEAFQDAGFHWRLPAKQASAEAGGESAQGPGS